MAQRVTVRGKGSICNALGNVVVFGNLNATGDCLL